MDEIQLHIVLILQYAKILPCLAYATSKQRVASFETPYSLLGPIGPMDDDEVVVAEHATVKASVTNLFSSTYSSEPGGKERKTIFGMILDRRTTKLACFDCESVTAFGLI